MGSGRGRGRGLREVEEADKNKWKAILVEGKGATGKKRTVVGEVGKRKGAIKKRKEGQW